jgi:hypothetical protein
MKRGPFCTGKGMLCADTALLQLKQIENTDANIEIQATIYYGQLNS